MNPSSRPKLSLRGRIVRPTGIARRSATFLAASSDGRTSTYRQWNPHSLQKAIDELESENAPSYRVVAREWRIPPTTLYNRHKMLTNPHLSGDSRRYFTDKEEGELASFLTRSAEVGCGRTIKQVIAGA